MTQQNSRSAFDDEPPVGDPWQAVGYLVSGVGVYGILGWLADRWLGTSFLAVLGILVGAGFGLYLTFARFNLPPDPPSEQEQKS
jgi:ATP synthase protein I